MSDPTRTNEVPGGSAPPPTPPTTTTTNDERTYALLIHLSTFVFPLIGPLVLWLIKRGESSFIDHHGKEAVNFQITLIGASLALFLLSVITCGIGGFVAVPAAFALSLLDIVCTILAAVRANEGVRWRYPWSVRLVT